MAAKSSTPPRLRHIAALWSLVEHPSAKQEWSLEKKIGDLKAAGFDGFATQPDKEHTRLAAKHGLSIVGYISSSKPSEFRPLILKNRDGGALRINVQLGDHDTPVEKAVAMAVRIVELGDSLGCPCDIEVHRDTCTETPEKAYAIAAGFKKATGRLLPMTWDFSHLSVVKHLAPPYWERLLVAPKLVQHARQFHFRPFNGHHCQIPVTDGTGRISPELTQWLPFLEKTITLILAGKQDGRDIFVCPEMGPVPGGYNLAQLPSSWEDAKVLRGIIDQTWKKALAARSAK
ncbi:MAG: xylose isomerase [Burkholderiales bacterium]|nr:xylose isomerase [Opitutaceae bacterium]